MDEIKLTYWNFRAQQGEPIRFIFAYAGAQITEIRIPAEPTYPLLPMEIKNQMPFGHVPLLEFGGRYLAQSPAIGRILAKKFDIAGNDIFEEAKCDEIIDALYDFQKARGLAHYEKDPKTRQEKFKYLVEYTIPKYMNQFNKIVKENGGKYLVGNGVTWADLHMAHFINQIEEKQPEYLQLTDYPDLYAAAKGILDLPKIQQYIATRPKDEPPKVFFENGIFIA